MIYAWLGALAIGVSLGLLGSGGSILTVPILAYVVKHDEKVAIAEALAIVGAIALAGALRRAIDRQVDFKSVLFFGVPGMAGAWFGAWLAHWVPGPVQLLALGAVMLVAAALMFRPRKPAPPGEPADVKREHNHHPGLLALEGLGVGVVTGLVGVGGGFMIVPALVLLARLPMQRAIGTSLAIISLNCAAGFVKYQAVLESHGQRVDWRTIAIFSLIGVIGALGGNAVSARINQRLLRRMFAVFLVLMAAYIIWRQSGAALG